MPDTQPRLPRLPLRPAIVAALAGYTRAAFVKDLTAGLVVGIVAIPLALAFAIASGVQPSAGLATAAVAGFVISALGGSRVQIGGPTGAFVVIVYGIVQEHGVSGLAVATVMAGVILVLFGFFRVGQVIKFIPEPVVAGFTAGIGAIILIGQLKEMLGLQVELPAHGIAKLVALARHVSETNPWAVAVAAATVLTVLAFRRFVPRVPGPVVALVAMSGLVAALGLPVETVGARFGELPAGLPELRVPSVPWGDLRLLVAPALTIAFLGAVESLLSAVVADAMAETRHDSDQELIAQGLANIVSPFFGGIPATGAIARTATNIQNGATTPVAGIVHAAVVLGAVVACGPLLASVPLAVLGGILAVVAYYMSDVPRLMTLPRMPKADAAVLLATLVLTVAVDLIVAIEVGMVLAAFLFMLRMSQVARVEIVHPETDIHHGGQQSIHGKVVPPGVVTYSLDGPFFFGAAERFQRTLERITSPPDVLIFRMRNVPYVDATGLGVLQDMIRHFRKRGTHVILSAVQEGPLRLLHRSGAAAFVGEADICPDIDAALERARTVLAARGAPIS